MEINLTDILNAAAESGALIPDGPDGTSAFYNPAIIGIDSDGRLVYSKDIMITLLYAYTNGYEEAIEFLEYNCWFAYVGEMTPIFIDQYLY
jgi:hypothetical protein